MILFSNFWAIDTRFGRLPYTISVLLLSVISYFVSDLVKTASPSAGMVELLVGLSICLFLIAAFFVALYRRFHDLNLSGGWALLAFVPVISFVVLVVMMFLPPVHTNNRFGTRTSSLEVIKGSDKPAV